MAKSSVKLLCFLGGLVAFRFHDGKDQKPFIFMISGFWDVPMTPQTIINVHWMVVGGTRKRKRNDGRWSLDTPWVLCALITRHLRLRSSLRRCRRMIWALGEREILED